MRRAVIVHPLRNRPLRYLTVPVMLGCAVLSGCATTAANTAATRPVPPAPEFASSDTAPSPDMTSAPTAEITADDAPDIVIAASDGIQASWSSITESPLARAGAELSNLGGAPIVLGAVAGIMIADAAPKGRAARSARALSGSLDTDALDRDFAQALGEELDDIDATIAIQTIEKSRDLPENAYVVQSEYTLAQDGSAIRVKTNVTHSGVLRYIAAVQDAERRLEQSREGFGNYNPRREKRRLDSARERLLAAPKYAGAFVYHSDPIALPDLGDLPEESLRADMRNKLVTALEAEREAQIAAAQNRHAEAVAANPSQRGVNKADRKLAKARAKAEKLYAESLEKAGDDEFGKMERMILGLEQWMDGEAGNTLLQATLDDAHAFIIDSLAGGLEGGNLVLDETAATSTALVGDNPVQMLDTDADGRSTMRVVSGPQAGVIMSVPEDGTAEYGRSSEEAR